MEFFSAYKRPVTVPVESGDRFQSRFMECVQDDGTIGLEEVEVIDTYALRQADKALCDVNQILRRYQMGDLSALPDAGNAPYADVSQLPDDLFSVMRAMQRVELAFNQMPADQRSIFGNDFRQFLAASIEAKIQGAAAAADKPAVEKKEEKAE